MVTTIKRYSSLESY